MFLFVVWCCSLIVGRLWLFVVCCVLFVVRWLDVSRLLFVVRCLSCVRCALFVVRCLL